MPQQTVEDLGKLVKAKYPEYKDLPDVEVGQKVKAKYPEYSQFADMPAPPEKSFMGKVGDFADALTNEGVQGLEHIVGAIPGVGPKFKQIAHTDDPKLFPQPTTAAGRAGKLTAQAGEMLLPIPGVEKIKAVQGAGKLAKVGMAALRGGVDTGIRTAAQTGDAKEALTGAAVGGAVTGGAAALANPASAFLKKMSLAQYGKVLHPLGRQAKEVGMEEAPKLMDKGYGAATAWTQEGLNKKLWDTTEQIGKQIESKYAALDKTTKLKLKPLYDDFLQFAQKEVLTNAGRVKDPEALNATMDRLNYIYNALGSNADKVSPSTLWDVRQTLDKYVFRNRLTADESVAATARINKGLANSMRSGLNSINPDLTRMNADYHTYRTMAELMERNVKNEFGKQQVARGLGMAGRFAIGAGVAGEGAHHEGADIWGTAAAAAIGGAALQTTAWRTVSAITKNKIADAIARGQGRYAADLAARAVARITASTPEPKENQQ